MDIVFPLDQLPEHILEEIFAFVEKNNDLRLVCKTFKKIINRSAQLMKNEWLIVDNALDVDSSTIYHHYQNFEIHNLSFRVFNWISNYQHKDRIKSILCKENEVPKTAVILQYILMNFNSLEKLNVDTNANDEEIVNELIKFVPNNLTKLKTLNVYYYSAHYNNILEMFSNFPTIKNLFLSDFEVLKFPIDVKWQLEYLGINSFPGADEINHENCKQFLISQQSSLKKFIYDGSRNYAYFVMRNLPNLEHLKLCIEYEEEFDDSLLLKNSNLQCLDIEVYCKDKSNVLKSILNYYDKIKYLSIKLENACETGSPLSYGMKFENLTHLALKGFRNFSFLNSNSLNIKVLVLSYTDEDENYDFSQLSSENFKNVEILSLMLYNVEDVLATIQKCPKLIELNLRIDDWVKPQETFINGINQILEIAVNVKRLGITEHSLTKQQLTSEKLQDLISRNTITIKLHKDFKSMFADDWGRDNASYIDI